MRDLTAVAKGGCLIYLTSHGSPKGVVLSDGLLTPRRWHRQFLSRPGAYAGR